eukprot:553285_1
MVTEAVVLEDLVETAEQALYGSVRRSTDDPDSCEEIQLETLRTCLEDPLSRRYIPGNERLENLRKRLIVIDKLLIRLKKHIQTKNEAKIRKYFSKYHPLFSRLPSHPDVQRAKEFVARIDIGDESLISDSSSICSSSISDREGQDWENEDKGAASLDKDDIDSISGVGSFCQNTCNVTANTLQRRPPYVVSSEYADQGVLRWLGLKKIHYVDEEGNAREWEMCYRTTREGSEPGFQIGKAGGVDAVYIIARCYDKVKGASPPEIVLVSQFRPPSAGIVLEFPAGLVDKGESLEATALRELYEETGYIGKVTGVSPPLFPEPGMSNAVCAVVEVNVTGRMEAANDEGEFIQVHRVREDELLKGVDKLAHDRGMLLDGPVWLYALGLAVATHTKVHKRKQQQQQPLLQNIFFWFGVVATACASAGLALMVGGGYPISLQGSRRQRIV